MLRFATATALLLVSPALLSAEEEKKWRWGDEGGAARQDREVERSGRNNDYLRSPSARYEIFENTQDFRPPNYQDRPGFGGGIRPGRPGTLYGNGYGQSGFGGGILTGPVPSWQREPPIRDFDKCKCTEKFNCNTPGISYGHCDVGKKYCCYSSQGVQGGPLPNRPHYSIDNGILSGPGGPVDHIPGVGGRPPLGAGIYGPSGPTGIIGRPPGILVGPGGPTGIIGRPPGYDIGPGGLVGPGGPGYGGPEGSGYGGQGVLVGPGGPTGVGVRPGYGGQGLLVGPGGPTGVVGRPNGGYEGGFGIGGPGLLVGPGGGGFRPSGFGLGRSAKDVGSRQSDESNESE